VKRVGDIVRDRRLLFVSDEASAFEAAEFMAQQRIGAVPVLSGEKLVGVFSERDLMTRVVVPGLDPKQTRIHDVMTSDVVVADVEDSHATGIAKMAARGCRHLPVVHDGHLLGFLSLRDLLHVDLEEKTEELAIIREYVGHVPPDSETRLHR